MAALGALWLGGPGEALGQDNPVFLDDSTLAADVLTGLPGLIASDNTGEAVRLLQRLLDQEGDRLVATAGNPDRFEPVRARVHRVLLESPELLDRYRTVETENAARLLAAGDVDGVERSRLLTGPGFDAAVAVAADHLAAARFESARLTLEQLETHPDRGERGRAARVAGLARQVAAYLPRPEVEAMAARWSEAAGMHAELPAPIVWPDSLQAERRTPVSTSAEFALQELVDTPLCVAPLRENEPEPEDPDQRNRRGRNLPEFPYVFPLVVGDTVYTTDGLWVAAWDRYTLTPRWRTKPRGADNEREGLEELYASNAYRRNRSRDIEEATTLSMHGRVLVVATGLVADGGRDGDPRLHALDSETGRVLWSSYIDELDEQLTESSSRGPAVFEGDIAVVAVRKISQSRRFASAYLAGIDLADGSLRWLRLAGSAGWLAYGGRGQWTDWPTMHEGVVYRADELGVIAAVEAGSGRFRWVHRMSGVESRVPSPRLPWAASRVVVDGETILVLSPSRDELLRIDQASGEILSRRDARPLGRPGYIFAHEDRLVAVSPTRVVSMPLATAAEEGAVRVSQPVADPGLMGRVVAVGDRFLMPIEGGIGVMDAFTLEPAGGHALGAPVNPLPLGQQLITATNQELRSYLVWEDAAAVLQSRLDADPGDSSIAITFAELAHRAGYAEEMLGPVDAALAALAADPLGAGVGAAQERLFDLLHGALTGALDAAAAGDAAGLGPGVLDGMAERMGMVAEETDQRATHLLVRSRLHEFLGRDEAAVADCQQILSDPALASARWDRASSTVRAEIDALARLDRLLAERGGALYEPFERAAAAGLAEIDRGDAGALERLGRSFPRAGAALRAWLDAAGVYGERGESLAQDRALDRGIRAAVAMRSVGLAPDPAVVGELIGSRVRLLIESDRLNTAAALLAELPGEWPGLTLTAGGEVLDPGRLDSSLRARAEARTLRPTVGVRPTGEARALDGWVLMRAMDRRHAQAATDGLMLLSAGRVGLFGLDGENALDARWTVEVAGKPALVRFDRDRVILLEPDVNGGSLVALDPADGRELWRSEALGEALARAVGPAIVAAPERFETPLDGEVRATDTLLAVGETTIAVVSRSGRVAAVDLATGLVAWSRRTVCQRVADAVAGEPVVVILDMASGEAMSSYTPAQGAATGRVRWLHVAPGSRRLVVGLSRGLAGVSLPEARTDWTLADLSVEQSDAAWAVGSRLFVQTPLRDFALVNHATGDLLSPRLDAAGVLDLEPPVDAFGADSRFVVLSPAGFVSLDAATGALLAADAIEPLAAGMIQPAFGRDRVVMVEREPVPGRSGLYRMHIADAETGVALSTTTLALDDRPRRVAILDGVVCVTAGDRTVAIPTGAAE